MDETAPEKPTQGADRQTSVDSAAYFEAGDEYDDYDDFGANQGGGGGGGGGKTNKRRENRGGGTSNVYSSKHTRAKEVQRENQKAANAKK